MINYENMDYIKIKGYKSIKDISLDFNPINILIGANGSGKSNLISFFELLNKIYEEKLQEYTALKGGPERILHKGIEEVEQIYFEISFDEKTNGYSATLQQGDDGFIFLEEYLIYEGDYGGNISAYSKEASVKVTSSFRAKYVRRYLKAYRKYHFHDTTSNSPFTKMSHVDNDSYFLYEDGSNLASFLYHIQNDNKIIYNRIIRTIQSIAPFFSDFFFKPNRKGYMKLQWQSKYNSYIYGVSDLSDGTIRFIALAALFLQPELPSSIIIDEPELGLHPFAIAKLAGMIKSVASRNNQVIIATQSADLVNHFSTEDIITVDQINGESQYNRLSNENLQSWLEEYSIGDLWQRNIIRGGQPYK